jgi:hypothetical protein
MALAGGVTKTRTNRACKRYSQIAQLSTPEKILVGSVGQYRFGRIGRACPKATRNWTEEAWKL